MRRALVLPAVLGALVLLLGGGTAVTLGSTRSPVNASAAAALIEAGALGGSRAVGADFGLDVALSANGRVALVGGPHDQKSKGAAWVFARLGGTWKEQIKLTGARVTGEAEFGSSVALSGNGRVALVGAPLADGKKGAAWIFTSAGGGSPWVGAKLTGPSEKGQGLFGSSVALSGDGRSALIGGPGDDNGKGAAWTFNRSASKWVGHKLTGGGVTGKARYGASVALSYDRTTALVGGPADSNDQGAVWVFTLSGSSWKQLGTKLTSNYAKSKFGSSIALSGDGYTALVGAPTGVSSSSITPAGSAWLLRRQGSTWSRRQLSGSLEAGLEPRGRRFVGRSVGLSSDGLAAVVGGALDNRFNTIIAGVAWVFARSGSTWRQQGKAFTSGKDFGVSTALSENGIVVLIGRGQDERPDLRPGWVSVFAPRPVLGGITPFSGPTTGGTGVTITGENFIQVLRVSFGGAVAASFSVDSATQIRAVSPPGAAGNVHIRVTNAFGTSSERQGSGFFRAADLFTYFTVPQVTAVSPASGPSGGGTQVTITGVGFTTNAVVKFGATQATSVTVDSPTTIRAVSPPAAAGTVDITVTTNNGTSAASTADRFTFVAPPAEKVITFDDLVTGGPGGAGSLVHVNSQYAGQGVTFNDVSAIDYAKGASAIPSFAHSGTVAIEQCVGVEFCTTPIRATFGAPKRMVRVWVGFSFGLNQSLQVQLRAFDASSAVVGTATATLQANAAPTPISTPLEVQVSTASITQLEVSIPGGYNSALAVDDVTFEGP
jgi:hypothetical protein